MPGWDYIWYLARFMGSVIGRIHYRLKVVFCFRHFTAFQYQHYTRLLTSTKYIQSFVENLVEVWLTCCWSYRLPFIFITIYGVVCVQLTHFSIGDWMDISIAHVIIIIKSEVSTFPIAIIFFRGCVPEMFVTSCSVTYCIYIPGKQGICFHCYCAVYDECKYSETFWLADRTRLFVQYIISLSSLCKLIWRHWTYKMPVIYFVECVNKIKHILSVIQYTTCGAVCFQFTHSSCDDWENIYTLSYYHQIGNMNYYPLFRVRSWNNGVLCMSFYILAE